MRAYRILCPVDFSDPSRRALHYAAALASREDAVLHVLYVVPAAMPLPVPILMLAVRPGVVDVTAGAAEALDAFVAGAALPRRPIAIVRDGPPVDAILACAAELAADLIVLGSHGRDGLGHLLFGSTAERVLHKAPCPTLVVPLHAEEPASAGGVRFTRIVCAVDFSPASTRALGLALSMAQDHGAALTVLHVVEAVEEDALENGLPAAVRARIDELTRTARQRLHAAVPRDAFARACSARWCATAGRRTRSRARRRRAAPTSSCSGRTAIAGSACSGSARPRTRSCAAPRVRSSRPGRERNDAGEGRHGSGVPSEA